MGACVCQGWESLDKSLAETSAGDWYLARELLCLSASVGRAEGRALMCLFVEKRSLGPSKTTQTLGAPGASLVPREEFFMFYCVI